MSIKTTKRLALGVIATLVFAPFAAIVPAQGAATTLTASSVTGTIAATASTSTATGTFSVTLVEAAATTWTNDATITLQLVDKFSDIDTCTIKANTDGSPAGTVTQTGVSDTLFSVASYAPTLAVSGGDLTVTIEGDYTDNGEIEHLTISGLTVGCSSTAPLGNIYVKVTAGTAEIDPANVTMTGTMNAAYADGDTKVAFRMTDGNFPIEALFDAVSVSHAIGSTGTATRVVHSAVAASPYFINRASSVTGETSACTAAAPAVCTEVDHGLRTGDALVISAIGDAVIANGDTTGALVYAIRVTADTFQVADTSTLAAAGTGLQFTTAATVLGGFALKYAGSGTPGSFTVADQGVDIGSVGAQVAMPANSHLAISAGTNGLATSAVYLGKIGTVGATYQYYSTGTQTATAAGTSFTTTATAGEINIDEITTSAINDGAVTESVVVTLTNGVFYSAPTVTGASIVATQTYPSATLSLNTVSAANIFITGTYRFTAGTAVGSYLTFAVAVDNDTDPVGYIGTATAQPSQNRVAILAGASISATAANISAGTTSGAAAPVITITESAAGVWKAGQVIGVCFPDGVDDAAADEDTFYTAAGNFPWATVSAGNVKLAGNVTTKKGTLDTAANVMAAAAGYDENVANQCVYWTVFSISTTASTIVINGGNADGSAAGTLGPVINTKSLAGVGQIAVVGGGALDAALVLNTATLFNRTPTTVYTVTVSTLPSVKAPGQAQAYADVTVAEAVRGAFVAGSAVTMTLSDSAGAASTGATLTSASGANAPVVTQTAASNIIWDYSVAGSVVTINIRTASSDAAASFKISNIKVNTIETKSAGVKTANSDLFVTVAGAGIGSNSFINQAAQLAAAAAPVVVAPSVAPSLTAEQQGNRVLLFGSCMADEGDMIIYVKSPGKAWSEKAKTLECAAGEYDGDIRASKKTKFYRVKQEGTGLWSTSKLVRP